jgi:SAM-dependent methyltransferase
VPGPYPRAVTSSSDRVADLAAKIRAAVAETAPVAPAASSAENPSPEEETAQAALARAAAHVTPSIPESSRLVRGKKTVLRLLRFLWRDQGAFNTLSLQAASAILAALAAQREAVQRLSSEAGRVDRAQASLDREVAEWSASWQRRAAIQDARLGELEKVSSGTVRSDPAVEAPASAIPPGVYSLFEERFRGSPEEIAKRQKGYLLYLKELPGPVLDVGCGRGELLRLLSDGGIAASGVEVNPIAVEECRRKGLAVEEGDALAALAHRPDGGLGAVVALQVVEHWPPETIFVFLREARRALAPGGVLIAETINIGSISAWTAFYLDPSHVRPVPAETLAFLAEAAGFVQARIEYHAPLPAAERLEERCENDAKLNRLLFAEQDYALVARVPHVEDGTRDSELGTRER